jgi:hypothetical protein
MSTPDDPGGTPQSGASEPSGGAYEQQFHGAEYPTLERSLPTESAPVDYPAYPQSGGPQQPGEHQQPGGYPPPGGYPQPGGYPPPGGYQQPGGYPQSGGYQQPAGYPPPGGYPPPPPPSYPAAGGYSGYAGYSADPYDPYRAGPPPGTNGLAIGALVSSLAGLLFCACLIPSIVGIVLGVIGMGQTKRTGQSGHGLALAGVIIGAVTLALGILVIILDVAGVISTHGTTYSSY